MASRNLHDDFFVYGGCLGSDHCFVQRHGVDLNLAWVIEHFSEVAFEALFESVLIWLRSLNFGRHGLLHCVELLLAHLLADVLKPLGLAA
jgi:hypothetical protein